MQPGRLLRHAAWLLAIAWQLSAATARAEDSKLECISAATAGQTAREDGKLLDAREQLLACARDVCPPVVKSHCLRWLDELGDRIPSIVVRAQDSAGGDVFDARLSIDGRPARLDGHPVELDPGDHVVSLDTASGVHVQGKVLLVEGEKSRVIVLQVPGAPAQSVVRTITTPAAVQASPPAAPLGTAPQPERVQQPAAIPLGAWALGAVGLAAGGASVYFGVHTQSLVDSLRAQCEPTCSSSQTAPARTDAILMATSIGVGGAALSGAVLWAILSQSTARPAPVRVAVQPLAGGAVTTFVWSR